MFIAARLTLLLAGLYAALTVLPPAPFPKPACKDGETSFYKAKVIGQKGKINGWGAETTAKYQPAEWTQKLRVTADGIIWSRSEKLIGGGRREFEAALKGDVQVRVVSWLDTFLSPAGKQESRLEADFTDPTLKYPPDMFPIYLLPLLLRNIDLNAIGVEHETRLYWGPMGFSRGLWRVLGKKKITVPAGIFNCYEVEGKILIDDEGVLADTIEKFLPKYYYYLTVEPPHYMALFKAPIPGRETLTDELIKFTPGK